MKCWPRSSTRRHLPALFGCRLFVCVPCYWAMDIRERQVVDVWPAQSLSFISISCPLHRKMSEWQWNGASSSSSLQFLASHILPKVKDAGGDHKNIFPATCFSLLFVFAQEAHKTTTKESGNGFPLSFNTPLYSLSAWCPSCLLCALK